MNPDFDYSQKLKEKSGVFKIPALCQCAVCDMSLQKYTNKKAPF